MKISGPKGPGPTAPPPPAGDKDRPAPTAGPSFREVLSGGDASGPVESAASAAVNQIAARLEAGEITSAEAVDLLVANVIQRRAPDASRAVQEQMARALREVVLDDPFLRAKVGLPPQREE